MVAISFKVENIKKKHKDGIFSLIENLNKEDKLSYSLTDEWLDYIVENQSSSVFIGLKDEKVLAIGTCMINETDRSHAIINIAVDPGYRRKGLASQLYEEIMLYCKDNKVEIIEAYIKKRLKPAVEFSKKYGLEPFLYAWEMEIKTDKKLNLSLADEKDLDFRPAGEKDNNTYAEIINKTFGDPLSDGALSQTLKDPSIQVYILDFKGQPVGLGTIQTRKELGLGYLYDFAIMEAYRGRGFGSYMIKESLRILKEKNIGKASLTVTGENTKALKLYEKLAFKQRDVDIILKKFL